MFFGGYDACRFAGPNEARRDGPLRPSPLPLPLPFTLPLPLPLALALALGSPLPLPLALGPPLGSPLALGWSPFGDSNREASAYLRGGDGVGEGAMGLVSGEWWVVDGG